MFLERYGQMYFESDTMLAHRIHKDNEMAYYLEFVDPAAHVALYELHLYRLLLSPL